MDKAHKTEIIRWANALDGTIVWYRHKNNEQWKSNSNNPEWFDELYYIIDDEFAQIRKDMIDGKQLFVLSNTMNKWVKSSLTVDEVGTESAHTLDKMITEEPEPIYYYQYKHLDDDGCISISERYYTDEYVKKNDIFNKNGWRKVESSKKTW